MKRRVVPTTSLLLLSLATQAAELELLQSYGDTAQTHIEIGLAHRFQYVRHRISDNGHLEIELQLFDAAKSNFSEQRHLPTAGLLNQDIVISLSSIDARQVMLSMDLNAGVSVEVVPGRRTDLLDVVIKRANDHPATVALSPTVEATTELAGSTPPSTATPESIAASSMPNVKATALEWLTKADQAIAQKDWANALHALNELLKLPPNAATEPAQEKIGDVRAKMGDGRLAKIEYELFLKLYPQSERSAFVRQKLNALQTTGHPPLIAESVAPAPQHFFYGSLQQQYTSGNSQFETMTDLGGIVDRARFSGEKQAVLISNLDVSYRYRSQEYDSRMVLRDTDLRDQSGNGDDRNRLSAAYWDLRALKADWSARLGRQTQNNGGVFGRFDGLTTAYQLTEHWRPQFIVGQLVDFGFEDKRRFTSLSVDWLKMTEHSDLNMWLTRQTAATMTDREAVGAQWRYTNNGSFTSAILDYDTLFQELNIISLQSNWQILNGNSYNMLIDYRRSPSLAISNAILGESSASLEALRLIYSEKEIQQMALDKTASSKQLYAGASQIIADGWQIGEDLRLFAITDTAGAGELPAIVGTGNILSYSVQLSGFNFPHKAASMFFQMSRQQGDQYSGTQLSWQYSARLNKEWRVEAIARYATQKDADNRDIKRLTPTLRLSWQLLQTMALECEWMQEKSSTTTSTTEDITTYDYLSLGYRWDF